MSAAIQGIYVALFGRPADPGGLAYWAGVTQNGADLSEMLRVLPSLPEYTSRFDGMDNDQVVASIYQALFGRAPDAEGLAFFVEALVSGSQSIATIAVHILNGARGTDKADIEAKIDAAQMFTAALDTQAEIDGYNAESIDRARDFLDGVNRDNPATPKSVDDGVTSVVSPGGQAPNPGPGGPGGGETPIPAAVAAVNASAKEDMLATIKANAAVFIDDATADIFDDLAANTGRLLAIGNGVHEHIQLFGPFRTISEVTEVVTFHAETEHAKQQFIAAVDTAADLNGMIAALKLAEGLSADRQDLITEWANSGSEKANARAAVLETDDYTVNLADIAGKSDADLAFLAANLLDARGDGKFYGTSGIFTAYEASKALPEQIDENAELVVDRAAPADAVLGDAGDTLEITINASGAQSDFDRYQGVKITDGGENYGVGHNAKVSATLDIGSGWLDDDVGQLTGIWITMQNAAGSLPNGGAFAIAEYLDADAAAVVDEQRPQDDVPDDFAGGFRFWSGYGWSEYIEIDVSDMDTVDLTFVFTGSEHVWFLNGEEIFRDETSYAIDAATKIDTVIFNSQNFGVEEIYNYSGISIVGAPAVDPVIIE